MQICFLINEYELGRERGKRRAGGREEGERERERAREQAISPLRRCKVSNGIHTFQFTIHSYTHVKIGIFPSLFYISLLFKSEHSAD